MRSTKKMQSLRLSPTQLAALNETAIKLDCRNDLNRVSWRGLVEHIADGKLVVTPAEGPAPMSSTRPLWWKVCTRGELTDLLFQHEGIDVPAVADWIESQGEWKMEGDTFIAAAGWS